MIEKNLNKHVEVGFSINPFMPTKAILYTYYQILENEGFIQFRSKKNLKPKKSFQNSHSNLPQDLH